jgi:hypothetical protein
MSTSILYHDNGEIKSSVYEVNEKREGEYEEFYNNGKLKLKCHYIDGKIIGKSVEYNKDGKISAECFYNSNNELDGKSIYYRYHYQYDYDIPLMNNIGYNCQYIFKLNVVYSNGKVIDVSYDTKDLIDTYEKWKIYNDGRDGSYCKLFNINKYVIINFPDNYEICKYFISKLDFTSKNHTQCMNSYSMLKILFVEKNFKIIKFTLDCMIEKQIDISSMRLITYYYPPNKGPTKEKIIDCIKLNKHLNDDEKNYLEKEYFS